MGLGASRAVQRGSFSIPCGRVDPYTTSQREERTERRGARVPCFPRLGGQGEV